MFWQGVVGQILVGFLSNLLFVLVLTAIGVLYVRAVLSRRSRPLRQLLGLGDHLPNRVRIVVSSMYVTPGGAVEVRVSGPTEFSGPVMNQSEYVSAQRLRDAIRTRPASRPLRALLDQLGLLDTVHDPIECDIVFSPQYVAGEDGTPVDALQHQPPDLRKGAVVRRIKKSMEQPGVYILVGGPAYNVVVAHLHATLPPEQAPLTFRMTGSRSLIVIHDQDEEREQDQGRETRGTEQVIVDYCVLQKISEYDGTNSTVFICAGLSSLGTATAVGLLASRWRHLADTYGTRDFALLYQFDNRRDITMPTAKDVDKALVTATQVWPETGH